MLAQPDVASVAASIPAWRIFAILIAKAIILFWDNRQTQLFLMAGGKIHIQSKPAKTSRIVEETKIAGWNESGRAG